MGGMLLPVAIFPGVGHIRAMPYPISDHYDGEHFFNPEPTVRSATGKSVGLFTILKARLRRDPNVWATWPKHVENKNYPLPEGPLPTISFIGHSTFLIRLPGLTILTDPVFSKRCSPTQLIGPSRVRAPGIALKNLPKVDVILLSHNHYDHMDLISLRKLRKRFPAVRIVTTLGNAAYLAKKRIRDAVELDWWQAVKVGDTEITLTPARHFGARTLWDRNETLWGGFWISHAERQIYFAGDTGATGYFKQIAARFGTADLALLPIGAYEPRWFMGPVHMNPADAVQAFKDLGTKLALGMHFGTFHLTAEDIDAPLHDLALARTAAGVVEDAFGTLDIGESVAF